MIFPDPEIEGLEYYPEELQCGGYYYWWYNYEYPVYSDEEIIAMFDLLKEKNRELILSSDTTDWLPSVKDIRYTDDQVQTEEKVLGNCDEYYASLQNDGKNFLSMISTSIAGTEPLNSSTVIGRPGAVYASSSALYIASRHEQYGGIYWFFDSEENIEEASTVHKFTLNNDTPSSSYAGSGVVKGRVLNQFSMDEHEGFFRIATTTGHVPDPNVHSTISVFKENGGELVLVGQTDNIAPAEDIRSARFDRDRGYIVTFKKTDPLFVFDLADPYKPAVAGELKIPGFSTYMHRMDDNHLLTIGYDAEDYGEYALFQGILLQIFDVSDMKNPIQVYKEVIGTRGSSSEAATNHLAFNFFKPKELLAIPMTICQGGTAGDSIYGDIMSFSGLMVYKVTTEKGFEYLGGVSHQTPETEGTYYSACSSWWTDSDSVVKRSVFMDDYVYSITENEIKVNAVSQLGTDIAVIQLKEN